MFSRNTGLAWIGIIMISGMFLMGQDTWGPPAQKIVFVTQGSHMGDLGGLDGADAICQAEAVSAGLTGTFKAWLSDSDEGPAIRFRKSNVPYVLVNGIQIADNWDDLSDGLPDHTITYDALGGGPYAVTVWSNTDVHGHPINPWPNPAYDNCYDWEQTFTLGHHGFTHYLTSGWTDYGSRRCDAACALYCFEQ